MKRLMTLICLLVLVGECFLIIGCGNKNKEVAGIYTTSYGDTLTLTNDGSATLKFGFMYDQPAGHGSFSYNGKEVKITLPKYWRWRVLVMIFKVAGDNLLRTHPDEIWVKQ